jgi:hypothetical protein
MATLRINTEITQQKKFSMQKQELLDLLWAQGKLPEGVLSSAGVAYDELDDELTVTWTERSGSEKTEEV